MTIEFQPTHLTGGLVLFLREAGTRDDFMKLKIPRDALSLLAIECINEIGMDASEKFIAKCREVVKATDPVKPEDYVPPWKTDLFTDEERDTMVLREMEEAAETFSAKDAAHDYLEDCEVVDCIALIDPDLEETCRILKHIAEDKLWVEIATNNEEEGEYTRVFDFCVRFGLLTLNRITTLGEQYVASYGS